MIIGKTLNKYLLELEKLQKLIFSFYIKRNFGADRFANEKKLLQQTTRVMRAMGKIRKLIDDKKLLNNLETLYQILFSLDLLKDRLVDHATFEICEQEFKNIDHCLSVFFLEVVKNKKNSAKHRLDLAIQALEIIFQNTIQVVAADPMVFLFFIKNLYALSNSLNNLL